MKTAITIIIHFTILSTSFSIVTSCLMSKTKIILMISLSITQHDKSMQFCITKVKRKGTVLRLGTFGACYKWAQLEMVGGWSNFATLPCDVHHFLKLYCGSKLRCSARLSLILTFSLCKQGRFIIPNSTHASYLFTSAPKSSFVGPQDIC